VSTLPLSVLDFVGIEFGETATSAIRGAVGIAQAVEAAGYRRATGCPSTTTCAASRAAHRSC
jgi:hypothetical protein